MPQSFPTTRRRFLSYVGVGALGSAIVATLNSCKNTSTNRSPDNSSSTNESITVDDQGNITNRRSLPQLQILTEDLGNGTILEMVSIPGGTFTMGSPTSEPERDDTEDPQHEVTVPKFSMGRYPITQAQWRVIMGSYPSMDRGLNRPVEGVSWEEAGEFCQKLSQKSGKDYRLPSEAEWEYACRAGTTTPFNFGETITPELANYGGRVYAFGPEGNPRGQTTEVGSFPPNAFGLYDMHGNVWEWCQDTAHINYKGAPTDGTAWIKYGGDDELKLNITDNNIVRGGSYRESPGWCRSASRRWSSANLLVLVSPVGFRVAL